MGKEKTYDELKEAFIEFLEEHPNVFGVDSYNLFKEFVEREMICPETFDQIQDDLKGHTLKDGRCCIAYRRVEIPFDRGSEIYNRIWAAQTFHAGGLQCPKK